jgi:hypothetical protein
MSRINSSWIHVARASLFLLALLIPVGPTHAATPLQFTLEFPADGVRQDRSLGYDLVSLPDAGYLSDPGRPQLPVLEARVALPAGFAATGVRVLETRWLDLPGAFSILPAQPAAPTAVGAGGSLVPPDPQVYGASDAFPGRLLRFVRQTDLAGQGMAVIEVTPIEYTPAAGTLRLATAITFAIDGAPGYVCGDYLPANASAAKREAYTERIREMVINPADARPAHGGTPLLDRALSPGDYDYVIICPLDFVENFQPLADWKTQKGVPATIVNTTWIYNSGGYTGTNEQKIRAFIADANATWGATYFLLGGDTNVIPTHWYPTTVDPYNIPEDTWFADLDDDWTVEVNVGRVSARYSPTVYVIVDKYLTYEKNPPRTDYANRTLLLGFDLDDVSFGQDTKEYIATNYLPPTLSLTRVYDDQPTNHRTQALAALNAGQSMVNHIDHCNTTLIGLGSLHHNWNLNQVDINAMTNGTRTTLFYTTGCFPCQFDDQTCIAESWVQKSGGGGYSFIGNTRYGWYNPGNPHTLSNRYDEKFFQLLWAGHYGQGECFTAHKNSFFPSDDTYKYIFRELTLLGDPEAPLWTADPESLVVTYPETLTVAAHSYTVHVATVGGAPVAGARVCLWKVGDVYQVATTGGGGDAAFNPNPASEGPMLVTMTRHNALCHEGLATVSGTSSDVAAGDPRLSRARLLPARPSPFAGSTTIDYALPARGPVSLQIFDLAGRRVRTLAEASATSAGTHRVVWDGCDAAGAPVAAGVYVCRLETAGSRLSRRLIRLR